MPDCAPRGWRPIERALTTVTLALAALAWLGLVAASQLGQSLCSVGIRTGGAGALRDVTTALAGALLMSCAMMLPAALGPMLAVARARYRPARRAQTIGAALAFAAAYLMLWTLLHLVAGSVVAVGRARTAAFADPYAPGTALACALLLGVGIYQASPWKARALARCGAGPASRHCAGRGGHAAPFAAGLRAGTACLGCCGPIMALADVFGSGHLASMGAAAAWLLVERGPGVGRSAARLAGAGLIGCGATLAVSLVG